MQTLLERAIVTVPAAIDRRALLRRATMLQRALLLAESGVCASFRDIKRRLIAEGYSDVGDAAFGPKAQRRLRALCRATHAAKSHCDSAMRSQMLI